MPEITKKKWYKSRMIWANVLGSIGYFAQKQFGLNIPEQIYLIALGLLNIILRFDTDSPIG